MLLFPYFRKCFQQLDHFSFSVGIGQAEIDKTCLFRETKLAICFLACRWLRVVAAKTGMGETAYMAAQALIEIELFWLTCVGQHDVAGIEQIAFKGASRKVTQVARRLPPTTGIGCNNAYAPATSQPETEPQCLALAWSQL